MDELPLEVCKIIQQYKEDMELLTETPQAQHYICEILAEERNIIAKICALSFGHYATVLRAKDILEASVDLIEFYRESENNWNKRHAIWGLSPTENPPACCSHIGYLVYQWLCLEGERATVDGLIASCLLDKIALW